MQLKCLGGKSACAHVYGTNEVTAIELRVAQKKRLNFESLWGAPIYVIDNNSASIHVTVGSVDVWSNPASVDL